MYHLDQIANPIYRQLQLRRKLTIQFDLDEEQLNELVYLPNINE